jgi:DNA-binding beta-propeller fold protein YncE
VPLAHWGSYGTGPGEFNYPRSLTVDARGDIFVSDSYNHRIQQLSPDGVVLAEYGARGGLPGQFRRPEGLVLDDSGGMVVVDADNARLQRYVPGLP